MTDVLSSEETRSEVGAVFADWFDRFAAALTAQDLDALDDLVAPDGWWRDLLALTWDLTTVQGRSDIRGLLAARLPATPLSDFAIVAEMPPAASDVGDWIQAFFDFRTPIATGRGVVRLRRSDTDGVWRAWTIATTMSDLDGHERPIGDARSMGPQHLPGRSARENWLDRRLRKAAFAETEPQVVVIGGGQGGLSVAANLGLMGVDTLVIERNERIGDSWRKRYHSLVLHDPVWADHLPYLQFPPSWPVYTPKDKIADRFESYASAMELNVWTGTEMVSSSYDEQARTWTIVVR
ncbi:MAG: nuclear transport factor 2 family protein, partial [Pseudonocardia sp.]